MLQKLLNDVLVGIKPSKEEILEERAFANEIIKKIRNVIKRDASNASVILTGSVAKGTFLRKNKDTDVFILFPLTIKKQDFREIVENTVKKSLPKYHYELKYAEHPYARVYVKEKRIDVVPAYKITDASQLKSAVDRTVLHTKFILRVLRKHQVNDVLLLKKFLKSASLYGAEIKVQGFSGYLCELLIINYKNFLTLLRKISRLNKNDKTLFIDIKKYHKTKSDILSAQKKFNTPLIVIDPTDKSRNVAAAVSEKSFYALINIAKKFLHKPSKSFFDDEKTFEEKLASLKKKQNVYLISTKRSNVVDDILWGQLRKLEKLLLDYLQKNDFNVLEKLHEVNEKNALIVLRFKEESLSEKKLIKGPNLKFAENVKAFKAAHKNAKFLIKNKCIHAYVKRNIITVNQAFDRFLKTTIFPSHFKGFSVKIVKLKK